MIITVCFKHRERNLGSMSMSHVSYHVSLHCFNTTKALLPSSTSSPSSSFLHLHFTSLLSFLITFIIQFTLVHLQYYYLLILPYFHVLFLICFYCSCWFSIQLGFTWFLLCVTCFLLGIFFFFSFLFFV